MNQFQALWARVVPMPGGPSSAEKAADAVSEEVSGKPVRDSAKTKADSIVHYATGAVLGGLYGLAAGMVPAVTLGRGILFGGAIWLFGDELAVPALRLGPSPNKANARQHALGIASHIIFGLGLDLVRRRVNVLISPLRP